MSLLNIFNQYSFIATSIILLIIVALVIWRWQNGPLWARVGLAVLTVAGLAAARLALNYQENYDGSLAAAEEIINNGDPTLLMLYSNY